MLMSGSYDAKPCVLCLHCPVQHTQRICCCSFICSGMTRSFIVAYISKLYIDTTVCGFSVHPLSLQTLVMCKVIYKCSSSSLCQFCEDAGSQRDKNPPPPLHWRCSVLVLPTYACYEPTAFDVLPPRRSKKDIQTALCNLCPMPIVSASQGRSAQYIWRGRK